MKIKIVLLLTLLLVLSSCTMRLSSEELYEKMFDRFEGIETYTFKTETTGSTTMGFMGQNMESEIKSIAEGKIDIKNQKLESKEITNIESEGSETKTVTETYIVDSVMYTKSQEIWTKIAFEEEFFDSNNQLHVLKSYIENGEFDIIGKKDIDVELKEVLSLKKYLVINLKPDLKELLKNTLEESQISIEDRSEIENMFKDYSINVWIDKKTFDLHLVKQHIIIDYEAEGVVLKFDIETETYFDNFNEEITIKLPEEAKNAQDMGAVLDELADVFENMGEEVNYNYADQNSEKTIEDCEEDYSDKYNKGFCYSEIAIANNNLELCKKAGSYADNCISEVEAGKTANTEKLIEICNAVSDEFDREMCFENTAIFMKKVELCKYSGSPGFCIEDVDVNKDIEMSKLITVCEGHSDEAYCFYDLAYHRGDKSLCERAGDMEDICNEEWDEYN